MGIKIIDYKGAKLHYKERCYELYRIYPNGKEWFCGYFRSKEDYDIELARCKNEEAGPDEYVIKEIPSKGIPVSKIHDIVEDRKRWAEQERQRAIELKRLEAEAALRRIEYEREEREWKEKHPGQKRPLNRRRFPELLGGFTSSKYPLSCPDGIRTALRFLYPDSEQKFVKATEFAKTLKPRRRKK